MAIDTVDHHGSAPLIAGEKVKVSSSTPGFLLIAVAVVSLAICLVSFAVRQVDVGVSAATISLLATGASLSWLTSESRRIRDAQRRWNQRQVLH